MWRCPCCIPPSRSSKFEGSVWVDLSSKRGREGGTGEATVQIQFPHYEQSVSVILFGSKFKGLYNIVVNFAVWETALWFLSRFLSDTPSFLKHPVRQRHEKEQRAKSKSALPSPQSSILKHRRQWQRHTNLEPDLGSPQTFETEYVIRNMYKEV